MHLKLNNFDMIDVRALDLDNYIERNGASSVVQNTGFFIKSSIREPLPVAGYYYQSPYVTPDMLLLNVGCSTGIKYSLDDASVKWKDKNWTDFPTMLFKEANCHGGVKGMDWCLHFVNKLSFFQNSDIREAYTDHFGNDVVDSVIKSNSYLQTLQKNIQKTDNFNTLFRSLGENDINFINETVSPNFSIAYGKPLFFIGLDGRINYTSINRILNDSYMPKLHVSLGELHDKVSEQFVKSKVESLMGSDKYSSCASQNYDIGLGENDKWKHIKPVMYYSRFDLPNTSSSTEITYKPVTDKETFYPLDSMTFTQIKGTESDSIFNKANSTVLYEAKNVFDSSEDFLKIKIEIKDLSNIHTLVLAGDKVVITTPYPYSIYNGVYVIEDITYAVKSNLTSMVITCIRPNIDLSWSETLGDLKDSEEFKFAFAPIPNRNIFYKAQ